MSNSPKDIRLPSFNDFSPGILKGDIRFVLQIVSDANGNRVQAVSQFKEKLFNGEDNKRSITNVPTTLQTTGLVDRDTFMLTDFGRDVLNSPDPIIAARKFTRKLILENNGILLIEAIRVIYNRGEIGSRKELLKRELIRLGVKGLSNATTDHTTFENWLLLAEIVTKDGQRRKIDNNVLSLLIKIDSNEISQLITMEPGHSLFLKIVRRQSEINENNENLSLKNIYDECLRVAPAWFNEDQMRKSIIDPLERDGWIEPSKSQSGKGGSVKATEKLLKIPLDKILPHMFSEIPADISCHINKSLSEIMRLLQNNESKYDRGLGLELLALRMLLALALEPRGFRQRAKDTGFAEVDLLAEGRNLLFSRWVVQCKNLGGSSKVQLSDVAKEVGIAVHQKAHVVMVVTTTDFTSEAQKYAEEVTGSTHLQFLLIPGTVVNKYLLHGDASLLQFIMDNASRVMEAKHKQINSLPTYNKKSNLSENESN